MCMIRPKLHFYVNLAAGWIVTHSVNVPAMEAPDGSLDGMVCKMHKLSDVS